MAPLAFLVLFSLASNVDALAVNQQTNKVTANKKNPDLIQKPVKEELKIAEGETGTESDASTLSMDAEIDQEERDLESKMLRSFKPSDELVAAWVEGMEKHAVKGLAKLHVTQICQEDIMLKKMEHAECADPWDKTQQCEKPYEVPAYRLGDTFYEDSASNPKFMQFYFPKSVAAKYLSDKTKKADHKTLLKVISGPEYDHYEKPSNTTMVVHLRLGDALVKNKDYMLRSMGYYKKYAKEMKKLKMTEVVLVTGDHKIEQRAVLTKGKSSRFANDFAQAQKMTAQRLKQVEKVFKNEGIPVTTRVNHNADCDFIYMANAPVFVVAGGTYSRLISSLVGMKGGKTLGYVTGGEMRTSGDVVVDRRFK